MDIYTLRVGFNPNLTHEEWLREELFLDLLFGRYNGTNKVSFEGDAEDCEILVHELDMYVAHELGRLAIQFGAAKAAIRLSGEHA